MLLLVACLAAGCAEKATTAQDMLCLGYPEPQASHYTLPYRAGETFPVVQGNCAPRRHPWTHYGMERYAYDFGMPIGTPVLAAREGAVGFVRGEFTDSDHGKDQGNVIILVHPDGTVTLYGHLTHNGVQVKVGQIVQQGERIGTSGNSGESPTPHLHFQVNACGDFNKCATVPVAFRNAFPSVQRLEQNSSYTAR